MKFLPLVVAISVLGLTACETTNMRMGGQNTNSLVSGSAAGGNQIMQVHNYNVAKVH